MLTDKAIKALKPTGSIYEAPDSQGLSVRVSKTGTRTFQYRYRLNGRPERYKIGHYPDKSLAEAREAHQMARKLVDHGLSPIRHRRDEQRETQRALLEAAGADSVKVLADTFQTRWVDRQHKRPENARQILDADVIPSLGLLKAKAVTRKDVIEMLDRIVDRGAPVQANRTSALVKQMFEFGIERGILEHNPCAGIRRKAVGGTERSRDRNLSGEELRQFWTKIDAVLLLDRKPGKKVTDPETAKKAVWIGKPMALALKLLLVTAQRRGELVKAKKADIDLAGALWKIPAENSKNGRAHDVPLSGLAVDLFKKLFESAGDSDYVMPAFGGKAHITERALTKAAERAQAIVGIDKWVPHDLRRTAAMQLAQLGVLPQVVEKILNHTLDGVMAIYNRHDYLPERRAALDLWAETILKLPNKKK
jgi:integrase